MLAVEDLPRLSDTSIAAEESQARWRFISDDHSKRYIWRTHSDKSPIRSTDLNNPKNESNWCRQAEDNKVHEPQLWSPSVRSSSVSNSTQLGLSSACSQWKNDRDETSRCEVEVKQKGAEGSAAGPEGFISRPPASPVTVLTRNLKSGAVYSLPGPYPRRFVRRLLRELIASLPLPPSDRNHATKHKTEVELLRLDLPARSHSTPPLRRSLSVQTHAIYEEHQQETRCEIKSANCRASDSRRMSEERGWAGGVRALRDAHVRLVLRQLRHVERLNRALDRREIPRRPTLN